MPVSYTHLIPERTVVEINTTFSEILGELERVVFAGYTNIGIVTNDNIIDNVVQDFTFQKTCIRIRPCATHIEIRNMVKKLCQEGVQFIIGCHQAVLEACLLYTSVIVFDNIDAYLAGNQKNVVL